MHCTDPDKHIQDTVLDATSSKRRHEVQTQADTPDPQHTVQSCSIPGRFAIFLSMTINAILKLDGNTMLLCAAHAPRNPGI